MKPESLIYIAIACALPLTVLADIIVRMNLVNENGIGNTAGQVTVSETKFGLMFTPALNGLPPGLHGFHIHQNPDCAAKEKDGKLVPRLKVTDIKGHSLVIHMGGDNHADHPAPLGGGGMRMACGVSL